MFSVILVALMMVYWFSLLFSWHTFQVVCSTAALQLICQLKINQVHTQETTWAERWGLVACHTRSKSEIRTILQRKPVWCNILWHLGSLTSSTSIVFARGIVPCACSTKLRDNSKTISIFARWRGHDWMCLSWPIYCSAKSSNCFSETSTSGP